jgi:hypothetical protein
MSKNSILPLPIVDTEQDEQIFNPYFNTINADPTNQLTYTSIKSSDLNIDPITGTATLKRKNIILRILNAENLLKKTISKTANYLLHALIMKFNATGKKSDIILLPIQEYCQLRNLTDRDAAIEQITKDLEQLHSYVVSSENEKNKSRKKCDQDFYDMSLCQGKGIITGPRKKKKDIKFHLSKYFHDYLNDAYIMPLHPDTFKLNPKTSSFNLSIFLHAHFNMNYDKTNANIVSVKTLLEVCSTIPTRKIAHPKLSQRIIEPFERDMDALKFLKWEFCNRNGEELTEEQRNNFCYDIFINCNVKFELIDHPKKGAKRKKRNKNTKKSYPSKKIN